MRFTPIERVSISFITSVSLSASHEVEGAQMKMSGVDGDTLRHSEIDAWVR